ncbi:MAG: shikimate kinase [Firmicutes bacterium]|nr:shikimate kinase [Bacillota bacterium]
MKKKSNIILIGMAGAGKSTTGVVVAKILAKDFIDGDLVIQHVTGKPLQTIINEEGNDGFRKVEEEVLCGINVENTVVAPGGSAIYYPSVFEHFKKDGVVVFLHVPVEEIERRLSNLATRGVTLEPGQTVADLYYQRLPLYQKFADITIDTTGLCLEETVAEIVKAVTEAE